MSLLERNWATESEREECLRIAWRHVLANDPGRGLNKRTGFQVALAIYDEILARWPKEERDDRRAPR